MAQQSKGHSQALQELVGKLNDLLDKRVKDQIDQIQFQRACKTVRKNIQKLFSENIKNGWATDKGTYVEILNTIAKCDYILFSTCLDELRKSDFPEENRVLEYREHDKCFMPKDKKYDVGVLTAESESANKLIALSEKEKDPVWESMDKSELSDYVKENMDAIIQSDIDKIGLLIEKMDREKVDFGICDSSGSTLLMKLLAKPISGTVESKFPAVIDRLIYPMTPEQLAIQQNGKHALQLLMENENKSMNNFSYLVNALMRKLPLQALVSITDEQIDQAASAYDKQHSDLLKLRVHGKILELGGTVFLEKLLMLAVNNFESHESECHPIIKTILSRSVKITSSMLSQLEKDSDFFKTILKKMSKEEVQDYLKNNLGRLFTLSEWHRKAIFEQMEKHNLDVHTFQDVNGNTCLMLAITSDMKNESSLSGNFTKRELLNKLSEKNSDISIKNKEGKTALQMLCERQEPDEHTFYRLIGKLRTQELYEMRDKVPKKFKGKVDVFLGSYLKEGTPLEIVKSLLPFMSIAQENKLPGQPVDFFERIQERLNKEIRAAGENEIGDVIERLKQVKEKNKESNWINEMLELANKRWQELNTK